MHTACLTTRPPARHPPTCSPPDCLFACTFFLFAVNSSGCWHEIKTTSIKLQCQEHHRIYIMNAILGIGDTSIDTSCQNREIICSVYASIQQVQQLKNSCNGQQECQVNVVRGRCYNRISWRDTDYETIQYFCMNNPGKLTMYWLK